MPSSNVNPARVILRLPRLFAAAIAETAAAAYPEECCGLLIGAAQGGDLDVTDVVPAANTAPNRLTHFAIHPQLQFDTLRGLRVTGGRIVGHYHSHPDGDSVPSAHDLAMACDAEAVWVVVGTSAAQARPLKAYVRPMGAESFREIPIVEEAP